MKTKDQVKLAEYISSRFSVTMDMHYSSLKNGFLIAGVILAVVQSWAPLPGQEVSDATGTRFRLLRGGRFIQGTSGGERALQNAFPLSTTGQNYGNAEGPEHVTWITRPFYLAETEVTRGQFEQFVKATGYHTSAESGGTDMVGWSPTPEDSPLYKSFDFRRDAQFNWRHPGFDQSDDHPVVGVSFADAVAYCDWLSETDGVRYRLPTEAEWEFACRAGSGSWFAFGDRAKGIAHHYGNFGNVELERHRKHAAERQWLLDWENDPEDGHVFTSPAGSFRPNPWGFYDMHGNVWEWCSDLWLDTVYKDYSRPRYDQPTGTAVDPANTDRPQTPTNDFHTIRGGSWYNGDLHCRSANRTYWDATDAACYIGFRLARDADRSESTQALDAYRAERSALEVIKNAGGKIHSSRGIDLEVRLEGNSPVASIYGELEKLTDLRRLSIDWQARDASLTQQELNTIAGLSNLKELEFRRGMNLAALDLSVLTQLTALESLQFPRDAPLNDDHLRALASMKSLRTFRCYGASGGLTDNGIRELAGNHNLESLQVWENEATGEFLRAFRSCPLKELVSTSPYNQAGSMRDQNMVHLESFTELQRLTLDGQNRLGSQAVAVFCRLSGLQRLHLARCRGMSDQDLSQLGSLKGLLELSLTDTPAGDLTAVAVGSLPRITKLTMGSIEEPSALTDQGVEALSKAFSLQDLELASNKVTDQGLLALGRLNRLKRLTMTSEAIIGSGLSPLASLVDLRDLSLRTPGLTDIAFAHLSKAKHLRKLRLAIRGFQPPSALTDRGVETMASATWLTELWLPRNATGITEQKIDSLNQRMTKTNVIAYTVSWKK